MKYLETERKKKIEFVLHLMSESCKISNISSCGLTLLMVKETFKYFLSILSFPYYLSIQRKFSTEDDPWHQFRPLF